MARPFLTSETFLASTMSEKYETNLGLQLQTRISFADYRTLFGLTIQTFRAWVKEF